MYSYFKKYIIEKQVYLMRMDTESSLLVRINPPKFWSATRHMSAAERETLLEAITKLAEAGDMPGLAHFDFITFTDRPDPVAA